MGQKEPAPLRQGKMSTPVVRKNIRGWKNSEPLTYRGDACEQTVASMVQLCSEQGAAVMFGITSDGGAYSVCVLAGTDKVKEYPSSPEDLHQLYMWLRDEYFGP